MFQIHNDSVLYQTIPIMSHKTVLLLNPGSTLHSTDMALMILDSPFVRRQYAQMMFPHHHLLHSHWHCYLHLLHHSGLPLYHHICPCDLLSYQGCPHYHSGVHHRYHLIVCLMETFHYYYYCYCR